MLADLRRNFKRLDVEGWSRYEWKINPADLDALLTIAEDAWCHREMGERGQEPYWCSACKKVWPCPTRRALDRLEGGK